MRVHYRLFTSSKVSLTHSAFSYIRVIANYIILKWLENEYSIAALSLRCVGILMCLPLKNVLDNSATYIA